MDIYDILSMETITFYNIIPLFQLAIFYMNKIFQWDVIENLLIQYWGYHI